MNLTSHSSFWEPQWQEAMCVPGLLEIPPLQPSPGRALEDLRKGARLCVGENPEPLPCHMWNLCQCKASDGDIFPVPPETQGWATLLNAPGEGQLCLPEISQVGSSLIV